MDATLVRDEPNWMYAPANGTLVGRRLRVYATGDNHITAVLTERHDDGGMSITNAAREIAAELARQYPGVEIEQIEHYTMRPGASEDFSVVLVSPGRNTEWKHIPFSLMIARFGDAIAESTG